MSTALVLSVLVHALLLSLDFGNQEFGLPGFSLPWLERRFEAGDLRVALVPVQAAATTPTLIEPSTHLKPGGLGKTEPVAAPSPVAVPMPIDAPSPAPAPVLVASERSDMATLVASVTPAVVAAPVVAAAPSATSPAVVLPAPRDESNAAQTHIDSVVRERDLELARLKRAKQEAQQQADQMEAARESDQRQEAERTETARMDAEREDAARQAVARNEAAQAEIDRLTAAQQAAVRQEAERAEAARLDAERKEAARQVVARNEAAQAEVDRLAAAQQAATRQASERAEATRIDAERQKATQATQAALAAQAARAEQEAKREARLRAIGRQLDEEAVKREAASIAARTLLPSSSSARRGRLFGRADPNTELILYAEAWSRKIELNMTFDMVREAAKQRHTNPLVTVALRSDGSVESVTFVVSSGVAEIDEAIRRIVQSQAPYRAFPPGLVQDYDVIEISRSWHFDMAVRLF